MLSNCWFYQPFIRYLARKTRFSFGMRLKGKIVTWNGGNKNASICVRFQRTKTLLNTSRSDRYPLKFITILFPFFFNLFYCCIASFGVVHSKKGFARNQAKPLYFVRFSVDAAFNSFPKMAAFSVIFIEAIQYAMSSAPQLPR